MEFLGALIKLFETKHQLFILALGAIFLLVAAIDGDVSIGDTLIPIDQSLDKLLVVTGMAFLILGFFLLMASPLIPANTSKQSSGDLSQSGENKRAFLVQKQQLDDLNQTLEKIEKLTTEKEDYISQNVQRIIRDVGSTLIEIRERPKRTLALLEWMGDHKKEWLNSIPESVYKKIGREKRKLFLSDIAAYLDLLEQNIRTGRFGSPRKVGLTRNVNDITPYLESMSAIEKQAIADIDKVDIRVLGSEERATFYRYLDRLIRDIQ